MSIVLVMRDIATSAATSAAARVATNISRLVAGLILLAALMVSACASAPQGPITRLPGQSSSATGFGHNPLNPNDWRNANARSTGQATEGVILAARRINARAVSNYGTNNMGAGIGAILGGIGGSQFGKGTGNLLATAAGALLGGAAGSYAGAAISHEEAVEYVVKTSNNQTLYIVQGAQLPLSVGQRVWVIGPRSEQSIVPA